MSEEMGDKAPGAHLSVSGPSSPVDGDPSPDPTLQAQAQILTAALQQLLPKQPSIATGKQPVRVKVLPTDTGRTSVVMAYDPAKDGLVFLNGYQTATDATTAHTAARLLQGQLGLCCGYAALDHILTTPVDSSGVITQYYVLSLPLNILKQQ